MATYQYLSLTPESLVVSMLPPEDFGRYMAVGTATRTSGQAMFFTLKDGFDGKEFGLEEAKKRCVRIRTESPSTRFTRRSTGCSSAFP